eukprot:scaffold16899_cov97-Isochrysis_galbana.AAC.7
MSSQVLRNWVALTVRFRLSSRVNVMVSWSRPHLKRPLGADVQGRVRLCRLGTRAARRHRDPPRARGVLFFFVNEI